MNLPEIVLRLSIDGIPLFKSAKTQFWPILCTMLNTSSSAIFAVSVFCGKGKPPSLRAFLGPFIDELNQLRKNGLEYRGKVFKNFHLQSIICDAPARSYIKVIKGHRGFGACERCSTKGICENNRLIFPDLNAPLRTDLDFRKGDDPHHHMGVSPLEMYLPDFDMVYGVPLDTMHMAHLGGMKKLMKDIWVGTLPVHANLNSKHRLTTKQISIMTSQILRLKEFLPKKEFRSRRGQSMDNICFWKAREFRLFLLYTGPIVLKKVLSEEKYNHFILFHTGMRLLSNPSSNRDQIEKAGIILKEFVSEFGRIYGKHNLCYNIHSLIHLYLDCLIFGCAESFSAYRFESFLGGMKKVVRSGSRPLAQWARRSSENEQVKDNKKTVSVFDHSPEIPFSESVIPNSDTDSYFYFKDKRKIVKVRKISGSRVLCSKLRLLRDPDLFAFNFIDISNGKDVKIRSTELDIFLWSGFERNELSLPLDEFDNSVKCINFPDVKKDVNVVIPLLHMC